MSRLRSIRHTFSPISARLLRSAVVALAVAPVAANAAEPSKPAVKAHVVSPTSATSHALPLVFEENKGQLPQGTLFAGRTSSYTVQVRSSELQFRLPGKGHTRTVTLGFTGSEGAKAQGVSDAGFRTNFYLSHDPRSWYTNVHNFNRIALRGMYPGIDAEFYSAGNEIEHDFIVAPNADAAKLAMHLAGAKDTTLAANGDVVLKAEEGALKLKKPHAYQVQPDGSRKTVDAEFVLASSGVTSDLSFKLGAYDHARELVIDPVITYATYIAGDNGSTPSAIASDASGNVYLTGSTTSTLASFGASTTTLVPDTLSSSPSPLRVAFIARLSRTTPGGAPVSGSQIAWLTYYGATSPSTTPAGTAGDVVPNAIALQPATFTPVGATAPSTGTLLYIAGQTNASGLPGTANGGSANLSTGTSQYGFIAEFNQADGTAGDPTAYATYVDGGNATTTTPTPQADRTTALQAITVDSTGAVTASGNSSGTQYATTQTSLGIDPTSILGQLLTSLGQSAPTSFCSGQGLSGPSQARRGLLTTLPATLGTPTYSTYVCGKTAPTATNFYTLTGVSVTPSTTAGTYSTYLITGSTNLDFPMNGVYDQPSLSADSLSVVYPTFFTPPSGTATDAFAASLDPNTLNVNWSYWSNGGGVDQSNGLTIDATTTPANLFIFGSTTTANFASSSETSPASTSSGGYNTFNGLGQQVGFAVGLNPATGVLGGISLLEGDGVTATTLNAAAVDGAGNLFLSGSTGSRKAPFPTLGENDPNSGAPSRGDRPATVAVLPGGEDRSFDPSNQPAPKTYQVGYLVRMPYSLAATDYVSFFGPASFTGSSTGVGVAVDGADFSSLPGTLSSPLAYVLLNETTGGSNSFTTSSAESQLPQGAATNAAYLAQVAFAPAGATPSFTYTASAATYSPNPVGSSSQGQSSLTLTWPVQVADAGTSQLVFNLPQSPFLSAYSLSQLSVTVGGGANVAASDCTLGTVNGTANTAANPGPGITCVIPQVPAATGGSTVIFKLSNVPVTSAIPAGAGSLTVVAAVYDATGNSADLTQSITTAGVPTLSISASAAPAVVNAATSATQTDTAGNPVTVTYTYTITNSSAYDSPNTKLVTNLNTTAAGPTLLTNATSSSSNGCDPTTASSGCDVPANGSLVYTVKGVYLDSNFTGVTAFPYTVTQGVPYVTFSTPATNVGNIYPASATGPSVQVNGTTTITANAITTNTPTYANGTSFQLGDQDVELTASFTNSGQNQAGSYTATVTLPQGYTSTSSNCAGAVAPYTSCTFTNIAPNQTVSFTITGRFNDTGTSTDAVAGPLTTGPSAAAVTGSQTSNTVTAQVSSVTTGPSAGTNIQTSPLPAPTSIKVTRVNALAYSIGATTPLASNTVNELGPLHGTYPTPDDQLSYTATIQNTGTSVARGLYFVIPVPNTASGTVPVVTLGSVTYSAGLSPANQLSCSYVAAQNSIVCAENDLSAGAALPTTTPHPTATPQTYAISFTTSYDETAVPQNLKTTQVTQGNGTIYAAAATYNPVGGLGVSASVTSPAPAVGGNTFTIQRLTSIVSKVSVSAVGSAAATNYADKLHITLDSNPAGNAPGTFDTILFQSSTSNMGPNDAAGLVISIPIPALTRVAVPQYCTLNGVTGPSTTLVTVTAASTMVCATPVFTTAASSTAPNQLRPATAACPAAPAPSGAALSAVSFDPNSNCLSVAFYAKYSDAPNTTGTVVGANPSGTVAYSGASIAENDIDTPSTPAATSTAAVTTVQRAAHLRLAAPVAVPTYTTGAALSLDPSGVPEVAQAALHMDPVTRQVTTGKVYNCLRYAISVMNEGPNYVLTPTLSYAAAPTTFVPTQVSIGSATTDTSSVNCAVNTLPAGTVLAPLAAGNTQSAFIDGYFDIGSLVAANSGTASFTTASFGASGYQDSDTAGTALPDYASTRTITLVNTPFTDANNQKFGITAYGSTPQATLIFTSVSTPGITSSLTATSVNCTAPAYDATHPAPSANVNICFPYAKSPLPADNGTVRNIYQPGKTPLYYQVPTTAVVPTSTTNPTSVCFTMTGAPFADVFVKPERVLLWLMANASAGTSYNPVGLLGSTQSPSPLAYQVGDVTSAVFPYLPTATSPSYLKVPAAFTFPQIPQAQPNQICGTVNGFTTTTKADATVATAAETFGVLEPVNFPPVTVAGSIASSASVSKGSTSALSDIYLRRTVVSGTTTTKYTYDYNDSDPCYIASASSPRQTCDDNPYLYTVTFTGGNTTTPVTAPALVTTLGAEAVTSAPPGSYNVATNINLSTSTNVFVSVADQATGADSYNLDIANAPGYTGNPFLHQGNFLSASYSIASHSSQPPLCDPGTSAVGGYNVYGVSCAGAVGGNVSGNYRYIRGGQKSATTAVNYAATQDLAGGYYVLGNVGAQSVTASNLAGAGLIPLPYPAPDPTTPNAPAPTTASPQNPGGSPSNPLGADPTTKASTAAIALITAGQTAGFVWPWLSSVTQSQGITNGALPNDKYDLACFLVDSATQQTAQALPAGVTCNISTTTPNSATASPTVYTFADPTVTPANGSSSPTIYITTAGGVLYAASEPAWKRGAEGLALAMLFPVLFFRKRLGKGAALAIVTLMLAAAPLLSGCGTGGGSTTNPGPTTPSGNYFFRVTATPQSTAGGEAKITSAVFEVSIH